MPASKNSNPSPSFSRHWIVVLCLLSCLSAAALLLCSAQGWTLYYGDAVSHINTARRIIDSRTPGIDQLGMPWLPVPHLIMLPLVGIDRLWQSGLAGAIPASVCFVFAGLFLYLISLRTFQSVPAATAAFALFALNPNILYLQSIPMTEMVFLAALTGLVYFTGQSRPHILAIACFSNLASMTRYDGWVLIPLTALWLWTATRSLKTVAGFCALASAGPLWWLAYNAYYTGNPLEFYNGPYSARAIQGGATYPGLHDWPMAIRYYLAAARLCAGSILSVIGLVGLVAALARRAVWPLMFFAAPCAFYILSMHSAGNPIFVPDLPPHSYYNTRYGMAAVLLLAFAAGAIAAWLPGRSGIYAASLIVLAVTVPWLVRPSPENWICWKESQVNSQGRRQWTDQTVAFLQANYRPGQGIFTSFGDLSGVYEEAGIPLRETLHDGNNPAWLGATVRPDILLHEEWAVALAGDGVSRALQSRRLRAPYHLVRKITVANAPTVEIYKRD